MGHRFENAGFATACIVMRFVDVFNCIMEFNLQYEKAVQKLRAAGLVSFSFLLKDMTTGLYAGLPIVEIHSWASLTITSSCAFLDLLQFSSYYSAFALNPANQMQRYFDFLRACGKTVSILMLLFGCRVFCTLAHSPSS